MKNISFLLGAIGVIGIAVALWYGFILVAPQWRADKARHECAQDYHMEYLDTATNTRIIKPIDELYAQCLKDKGL